MTTRNPYRASLDSPAWQFTPAGIAQRRAIGFLHPGFRGIGPNDRVTYRTPQGQLLTARAQRGLLFAFHVVCDAGGGRPVVVDAYNYVSHRNARKSKR